MNDIEGKLKELTGIAFNNWNGFKTALEHGQGGPPAVQNGKVEDLLNTVVSIIIKLSPNDDYRCVSDYIQDYMDDEFNVLLEDDSHLQITEAIYLFCKFLRAGNETEIMSILDKLPVKTSILTSMLNNPMPSRVVDSSDDDDDDDDDVSDSDADKMEQDDPDPGWTVVSHKRK